MLGVDVDAEVRERAEEVLERGSAPARRPGPAAPRPRSARLTRRSMPHVRVEVEVVEGEQHAVGRDVHVGLDVAVAEVHGVLERRHRVLGRIAGAAAVGERDRVLPVEEWMDRLAWRGHDSSIADAQ